MIFQVSLNFYTITEEMLLNVIKSFTGTSCLTNNLMCSEILYDCA